MPEDSQVYNPIITGFSGSMGPLNISLNKAKKTFGRLPSAYGFVSAVKGSNIHRSGNKALNLKTGYFIRELLSDRKTNLKKDVFRFFKSWHRDLKAEFDVNIQPFFNINNPGEIRQVLKKNRACIHDYLTLDIRQFLSDSQCIRKDILNSISANQLLSKASDILTKKIKQGGGTHLAVATNALNTVNCCSIAKRLKLFSDDGISIPEGDAVESFSDEIGACLLDLNRFEPLSDIHVVHGIKGVGIEFEFATRNYTYLELGKKTGDCTADKRNFQADSNIENIFWTVFSWILDRNYQILKVFFDGEFVMKAHLLPLYITGSAGSAFSSVNSEYLILAVDAVETTLAFRDDQGHSCKPRLFEKKNEIFYDTMAFIGSLADAMNIHHIYAEKFSNTPWVRELFAAYPEIFFHVDHLEKIDQIEDVFTLAEEISSRMGYEQPKEVFMELQMKNTYLSPGYINKAPGVKSFAVVKGNVKDGIPMKRIIGV